MIPDLRRVTCCSWNIGYKEIERLHIYYTLILDHWWERFTGVRHKMGFARRFFPLFKLFPRCILLKTERPSIVVKTYMESQNSCIIAKNGSKSLHMGDDGFFAGHQELLTRKVTYTAPQQHLVEQISLICMPQALSRYNIVKTIHKRNYS